MFDVQLLQLSPEEQDSGLHGYEIQRGTFMSPTRLEQTNNQLLMGTGGPPRHTLWLYTWAQCRGSRQNIYPQVSPWNSPNYNGLVTLNQFPISLNLGANWSPLFLAYWWDVAYPQPRDTENKESGLNKAKATLIPNVQWETTCQDGKRWLF